MEAANPQLVDTRRIGKCLDFSGTDSDWSVRKLRFETWMFPVGTSYDDNVMSWLSAPAVEGGPIPEDDVSEGRRGVSRMLYAALATLVKGRALNTARRVLRGHRFEL